MPGRPAFDPTGGATTRPGRNAHAARSSGATSIAGLRVEALADGRARLTPTLEMRGFLIPVMRLFHKDLTNRYLRLEAEGMKRAAESA